MGKAGSHPQPSTSAGDIGKGSVAPSGAQDKAFVILRMDASVCTEVAMLGPGCEARTPFHLYLPEVPANAEVHEVIDQAQIIFGLDVPLHCLTTQGDPQNPSVKVFLIAPLGMQLSQAFGRLLLKATSPQDRLTQSKNVFMVNKDSVSNFALDPVQLAAVRSALEPGVGLISRGQAQATLFQAVTGGGRYAFA